MIKGALFTIGILATLGGFGLGALTVMGAAMSDNVSASNDQMPLAYGLGGVGLSGVAMIIGACFL